MDTRILLESLDQYMQDCDDRFREDLIVAKENYPNHTEIFGPNTYGEHELKDRLSLAAEFVASFCESHGAITLHPEIYRLVFLATSALNEAYVQLSLKTTSPSENLLPVGTEDVSGPGKSQ